MLVLFLFLGQSLSEGPIEHANTPPS